MKTNVLTLQKPPDLWQKYLEVKEPGGFFLSAGNEMLHMHFLHICAQIKHKKLVL